MKSFLLSLLLAFQAVAQPALETPGTRSPKHKQTLNYKKRSMPRPGHAVNNIAENAVKQRRIVEAVEEACPWAIRGGKVLGKVLSKCALPVAILELVNEVGKTFIWGTPLADGTLTGNHGMPVLAATEDPKELKRRRDMAEFEAGKASGIISDEFKSVQAWVDSGKLTKHSFSSTEEKIQPPKISKPKFEILESDQLEYLSGGKIGVAYLHRPSGLVVKVILEPDQKRLMIDYDENGNPMEMYFSGRDFTRSEALAGRILTKMAQDHLLPAGISVSPLQIIEDEEIIIAVKPFIKGDSLQSYWASEGYPLEIKPSYKLFNELKKIKPFRCSTLENTFVTPNGITLIDTELMGQQGLITSVKALERECRLDPTLRDLFSFQFMRELATTPFPVQLDVGLAEKLRYLVHSILLK